MTATRDTHDVEALITDRYLESLLATRGDATAGAAAFGWEGGDLDRGVRLASLRLRRDLPRFHPSFRFEERLALRLAEAAAAMHVARAVGSEGVPVPIRRGRVTDLADLVDLSGLADVTGPSDPDAPAALRPSAFRGDDDGGAEGALRRHARPILIGGAVASAAISIAGAAIVAWRRSHHPVSPMARAARAAHALRLVQPRQAGVERPD